ncbi:hypothetical protein [Arhodomonas sp. AD133]|uniref:hypothetical protein n=1 Tax=Arhodomonas sp. AD133 TaxID=3415009 RepID=UPI003EB8C55B
MQLAGITLPDNVHWPDEPAWTPTLRETTPTLTGATIVDVWQRQTGRPITLVGLWVPRSLVEQLWALEADPASEPMTLTLPGGRSFSVLWRQESGAPAVQARPLWDDAPDVYTPDSPYDLEIRLQEA